MIVVKKLMRNIMTELKRFAREGNADQCFAILDDGLKYLSPTLEKYSKQYTNGILDDTQFCEAINEYING